ncbi:MAG: PilZ domain-containing protein [Treponema sp.]|jgi:hypothetical protein|nr:PilZ domain-containing protein [Treponema sp.]
MPSFSELRKSQRYRTIAHARISDVLEGENLVKNLSITGCCLECTAVCDIKQNEKYKIVIHPETASGVSEFEIQTECRWIRAGDYSCEIGFQITASPKGKNFQRYVDYLTYHSELV